MKMVLNFVSQYFKVFNSTKKSSCRKLQLQPHLKNFLPLMKVIFTLGFILSEEKILLVRQVF